MKAHTRAAKININADALRHNFQQVKKYAPESKVMAVIKANAYGHGAKYVAGILSDADAFALATPQEAISLRQAGISKPLLVLQGFSSTEELETLADLDIQTVIHQTQQIDLLEQYTGSALDVWLKVDTGMHRLGFAVDEVEASYKRLQGCQAVKNIRLMSHFANADVPDDEMNQKQLTAFIHQLETLEQNEASMANSAALVAMPDSRLQWVRPGIMLYGSSPLKDKTADELGLKAVMNFESELISVQQLKQGDTVGYGGTWKCPEDMPVGVIAVGYADGYPRHAKSATPVWINNTLSPLVGRVSMDSICVDLRGVEAETGDRVVLWGDELSVDIVAAHAGTIAYELMCHAGAGLLSISE